MRNARGVQCLCDSQVLRSVADAPADPTDLHERSQWTRSVIGLPQPRMPDPGRSKRGRAALGTRARGDRPVCGLAPLSQAMFA